MHRTGEPIKADPQRLCQRSARKRGLLTTACLNPGFFRATSREACDDDEEEDDDEQHVPCRGHIFDGDIKAELTRSSQTTRLLLRLEGVVGAPMEYGFCAQRFK